MNEQETLETILNNIVGIDLNPLAAVAARTNYLLALGDLLAHRTREIDIPVYLADSILTPAAGQELFNQDRYELNTVVGQFDIPSCLKTREQIDNLCNLLEESVTNEVDGDVFLDRARRCLGVSDDDWEGMSGGAGAAKILRELFEKLAELHNAGLDGIWARILQNAFMPLFIGRFDLIAGNPPWVNWESLPAAYKHQIAPLWDRHQLFPHRGFRAILGASKDDVSVLMSYIVISELCKPNGTLGFLITQSVFKASAGGQGFRRFRLGDGTPLKVLRVEDFSDFQPFEGATNRTAAFYIKRDEATVYPVDYAVWQKVERGGIGPAASLGDVIARLRCLHHRALPVDPNDDTSAWLTGREPAIESIRHVCGPSEYTARKGITASIKGVFWVEHVDQRPDGKIVVRNHTEGARRRVRQLTVDIEPDLVYPLLRGRDVRRWRAEPSLNIIVTHRRDAGLSAIPEREMQRTYPRTYAYLRQFEEDLKRSGIFKRYFTRRQGGRVVEVGPFYSMFNVGPYTFADHKVVFREISSSLQCAVVATVGDRTIIPDHKLVLISVSSEDEAHYLCGLLNSTILGFFALSYAVTTQFSTHLGEYVHIPSWDSGNRRHRAVAQCSRRLHDATSAGQSVEGLEGELDQLAASLLGITDEQLAEIRASYRELTKADLREAREADYRGDEDDEEGVEAADSTEAVVSALDGNDEMTAAEVAAATGIDAADLRALLRQLIEAGQVEKTGRGRGTRYRLLEGGEEA